jgi:DNA (cytosine-5)-methyltransferase 1
MNELALFAGAGGGLLASDLLGIRTICAVERDEFSRSILIKRQNDRTLNTFPIWDDVRTFDGTVWRGSVDLLSGGFPCQAFSTAAHGRNVASKDLWPEMRRIARECVPKFIFAENVSELAINRAAMDLRADGYECTTTCYSAQDMGADHIRKRYWLLAYADRNCEFRSAFNAKAQRLPEFCPRVWETNPNEFRVPDGMAHRVDKLRAIGNGQVPCVAAAAFLTLWARMLSEGR